MLEAEQSLTGNVSTGFIKGVDGVGIADIETGSVVEDGDFTNTELLIHKTDGTTDSVLVSAKKGEQGPQGKPGESVDLSDYATKQYVDDAIANNVTTALEGVY